MHRRRETRRGRKREYWLTANPADEKNERVLEQLVDDGWVVVASCSGMAPNREERPGKRQKRLQQASPAE
jgi:hypothetical protein